MKQDRMIRLGVIGLGIMGRQYVRIYQENCSNCEVVAVAARNPERTQKIANEFGIERAYTDWRQITQAKDIDAVCVALPDDEHFAAASDAIAHGKHVLIEKPMTTSLAEADDLVDLVERHQVKVQVAFNHRWLAPYNQGYQAIQQGAIGLPLCAYARKNDTIYVPTEFINWAHKTTPAWFLSCHDIDLVRWFFADEPVEVRALGVKKVLMERGIDTYDMIQAQVSFARGGMATFESGWIYPNSFPTMVDSFIEVVGESGHLHFDRKREGIEISTNEKFSYPKTFLSQDIFGRLRGAFPACLEDFLRCIREDRAPAVGVRDGRQVTAVLTAIHESLASGQVVKVPSRTK
ncbi:Gfo/Idh/MocA family protein [Edaphobacter flagellatus]|uniref:Gfo/Idh/MocA family protein n=1 Tax=Edaphobacter flagellatus TaxID=1933044 RepID=UPI0021B35E66|nr:Gfo/Idh/MocA family oxidoreductase [Edaphobacter flagellatus]